MHCLQQWPDNSLGPINVFSGSAPGEMNAVNLIWLFFLDHHIAKLKPRQILLLCSVLKKLMAVYNNKQSASLDDSCSLAL